MDNIFWSTCPTEMLWYSNLKYNQPGVHFCNYYKYSGPPYTFIASIWKLLFVLAFLSFDMQEGASLKKDFKPHWKKVIFLSQIVGWKPIVHCHNTVTTLSQQCHNTVTTLSQHGSHGIFKDATDLMAYMFHGIFKDAMDLVAYSKMPRISWHICFMEYSKMPRISWSWHIHFMEYLKMLWTLWHICFKAYSKMPWISWHIHFMDDVA